jgi:nicotinate-nucleotide pyrophosphorylase (carboxylating)
MNDVLKAAASIISLGIAEDIGSGDATSEAVLAPTAQLRGKIVAKQDGTIAGLPIAAAVFQRVDDNIRFSAHVEDGHQVSAGTVIAEMVGPAQAVLAAERLALNFLQHLSGIATLTRRFVDAVRGTPAVILDTRKTIPGYRVLEKYAVRMGGGHNHRFNLHEMLLIKDNHIAAAGSIREAVAKARRRFPDRPLEVEVSTIQELQEAADLPVDRIMLDNMGVEAIRRAVVDVGGRVPLEASGNVTLSTVSQVAATGVDYISVGALTHSAPAMDIGMDVWTSPASGEK